MTPNHGDDEFNIDLGWSKDDRVDDRSQSFGAEKNSNGNHNGNGSGHAPTSVTTRPFPELEAAALEQAIAELRAEMADLRHRHHTTAADLAALAGTVRELPSSVDHLTQAIAAWRAEAERHLGEITRRLEGLEQPPAQDPTPDADERPAASPGQTAYGAEIRRFPYGM